MGRKGKVFAKTDKTEGGRETGRLAIWAPHGTGRRHGTGAGAGRGGRIQRETLENAKKDYTAQGAMPGGEEGGNGKAPQKGPAGDAKGPHPESRKGRMEDPQGHSRTAGKPRRARKGKEKEKGRAHARLPPALQR